ncbi:MAG: diadenylate cyclase CdaA [Bacillota bacterium]|nr:diadenylate cyclase CdaA [Bacillota bacterium]
MAAFFSNLLGIIKNISIWNILDISVVAFIFYKGYQLIKETRAFQLFKGIIMIIILIPISDILHLNMVNWILNKTLAIGLMAVIIIFQPEIRRALEHLGNNTFKDVHIFEDDEMMEGVINQIVTAADNLASTKTGALIVVQHTTALGEIIDTGTKIDAIVSSALLENIFVVNTPLHDGATIIINDRIAAAGCFLPLTNNNEINKNLGTRHRAALGISENSDAIIIVVSEETGVISLAVNGKLTRNYDRSKLKNILIRIIKNRQVKKVTWMEKVKWWKRKESRNG